MVPLIFQFWLGCAIRRLCEICVSVMFFCVGLCLYWQHSIEDPSAYMFFLWYCLRNHHLLFTRDRVAGAAV